MKLLWVCHWNVKMPGCGCVEHGIDYITFYVQKHIAPLVALFWFPAGSGQAARGACICETHWYLICQKYCCCAIHLNKHMTIRIENAVIHYDVLFYSWHWIYHTPNPYILRIVNDIDSAVPLIQGYLYSSDTCLAMLPWIQTYDIP